HSLAAEEQVPRSTLVVADEHGRLTCIDFPRGLCIILVVMMHFDEIHFTNLQFVRTSTELWDAFTSIARPARMPTFFFISGFLASRSLNKPFKDIFDNRIGVLCYVYVIWTFFSILTLWLLFREAGLESALDFMRRMASELLF